MRMGVRRALLEAAVDLEVFGYSLGGIGMAFGFVAG
jgi:hypothetical protein